MPFQGNKDKISQPLSGNDIHPPYFCMKLEFQLHGLIVGSKKRLGGEPPSQVDRVIDCVG